jgi:hypothetical protein
MFQIFIYGYGDTKTCDIAGFTNSGDDYMAVFTTYVEQEVEVGNRILFNGLEPMEVVELTLGYGKTDEKYIPQGWKGVLLLKSTPESIEVAKATMTQVDGWGSIYNATSVSVAVIHD